MSFVQWFLWLKIIPLLAEKFDLRILFSPPEQEEWRRWSFPEEAWGRRAQTRPYPRETTRLRASRTAESTFSNKIIEGKNKFILQIRILIRYLFPNFAYLNKLLIFDFVYPHIKHHWRIDWIWGVFNHHFLSETENLNYKKFSNFF